MKRMLLLMSFACVVGLLGLPALRAQDVELPTILPIVPELSKDNPSPKAVIPDQAPAPPEHPEQMPAVLAPDVAQPQQVSETTPQSDVTADESVTPKAEADPQINDAPVEVEESAESQKVADKVTDAVEDAPKDNTSVAKEPVLSIGDFEYSLMFAPEDINTLKRILIAYEKRKSGQVETASQDSSEADLLAELLRNASGGEITVDDEPSAPVTFPTFYLGSVVFNHKGDWSLWVNQRRATANNREILELGIRVRSVGREYAILAWKPDDLIAAKIRWEEIKEADSDVPRAWKHREVPGARIDFDEEKGEFVVSMLANQTFAADTMQVLEGRVVLEKPPVQNAQVLADEHGNPLDPASQTLGLFDASGAPIQQGMIPSIPENTQGGDALERGAANSLINNLNNAVGTISGVMGGENPNESSDAVRQ